MFSANLFSQHTSLEVLSLVDDVNRNTLLEKNGSELDLSKIKGSPYKDENFIDGFVYIKDSDSRITAGFRYNIYNDAIEFIDTKDQSIKALHKKEGMDFTFGDESYIYKNKDTSKNIKSGYYKVLLMNEDATSLFVKYSCDFIQEIPAPTPLQQATLAEFKTKTSYYILIEGIMKDLPKSKKKIIEVFSSHRSEMKTYISKNKLNVKNEKDLIRIVSYYNSLN